MRSNHLCEQQGRGCLLVTAAAIAATLCWGFPVSASEPEIVFVSEEVKEPAPPYVMTADGSSRRRLVRDAQTSPAKRWHRAIKRFTRYHASYNTAFFQFPL